MLEDRMMVYCLKILENKATFSRAELMETIQESGKSISEASFKLELQKMLKEGAIIRVGRNRYCVAKEGIGVYSYEYSDDAKTVANILKEKFPYLNFTIMDFVQLNEFVNHQLAHNVIHVSVEEDLGDFVFDVLKEKYPGKVLINPTPEIYHQYWYDGMIVVGKLISEAPMGQKEKWNTRIEKLLVDVITNSILLSSVSEAELINIYEGAFAKYAIDESCMFRYAKRRGAENKIREFIKEKTNVQLKVG
ncbi:MAG: hypothetical protein J6C63_02405 [Lachnospiraceae bacterium]|nr:hypothetical protein [Lachnospiraceae bacterium]